MMKKEQDLQEQRTTKRQKQNMKTEHEKMAKALYASKGHKYERSEHKESSVTRTRYHKQGPQQ